MNGRDRGWVMSLHLHTVRGRHMRRREPKNVITVCVYMYMNLREANMRFPFVYERRSGFRAEHFSFGSWWTRNGAFVRRFCSFRSFATAGIYFGRTAARRFPHTRLKYRTCSAICFYRYRIAKCRYFWFIDTERITIFFLNEYSICSDRYYVKCWLQMLTVFFINEYFSLQLI